MNDKVDANDSAVKDVSQPDWVFARSSCSLPKVFSTLRTQVEEDVKTRNAQRLKNSSYEFIVKEDVGEFTVILKGEDVQQSVAFRLLEHSISVQSEEGDPRFEIGLIFDDDGQCRLLVNHQQHEFWQVRRMALEGLFFPALISPGS